MLKSFAFSFVFLILNSCQSQNKVEQVAIRCISSINRCAGFLSSSNSIENLLSREKNLRTLSSEGSEDFARALGAELAALLNEGEVKYLVDGAFSFKEEMSVNANGGGALNDGTYHVDYQGSSLFLKQLSKQSTSLIVKQVLHAKILNKLEIGPRTDLVLEGETYFLVMENLSGINIKETLYPGWRLESTKRNLDKMLGRETKTVQESIGFFAKYLLSSKPYLMRLEEIVTKLEQNGFESVNDFQFMIDLEKGPDSIMIIDTESFQRSDTPEFDHQKAPRNIVSTQLGVLRTYTKPVNMFFRRLVNRLFNE